MKLPKFDSAITRDKIFYIRFCDRLLLPSLFLLFSLSLVSLLWYSCVTIHKLCTHKRSCYESIYPAITNSNAPALRCMSFILLNGRKRNDRQGKDPWNDLDTMKTTRRYYWSHFILTSFRTTRRPEREREWDITFENDCLIKRDCEGEGG